MAKKKDNALVQKLRQDPELNKDADRKMLFLSLARTYTDDLEANLERTSMDLATVYEYMGIDFDTWREFLLYPLVKTYLEDFKSEKMLAQADAQIMSGNNPQHALKVKEDIRRRGGDEDRSNFVVFFVPELGGDEDAEVQIITSDKTA